MTYERKSLKETIMERDGMPEHEADEMIRDFASELEEIINGDSPSFDDAQDLMATYFGLEPDYLDEFLF